MKLQLVKTSFHEIDMEDERKRIKECDFTEQQKVNLLKVCDLFEEGKYQECRDFLGTWGRDEKLECPEVEFVDAVLYDLLWNEAAGHSLEVVPEFKSNCVNCGKAIKIYQDEFSLCDDCTYAGGPEDDAEISQLGEKSDGK